MSHLPIELELEIASVRVNKGFIWLLEHAPLLWVHNLYTVSASGEKIFFPENDIQRDVPGRAFRDHKNMATLINTIFAGAYYTHFLVPCGFVADRIVSPKCLREKWLKVLLPHANSERKYACRDYDKAGFEGFFKHACRGIDVVVASLRDPTKPSTS